MASKHITIQHFTLCGSRYDNIAFKGGHICKKCINVFKAIKKDFK